MGTVLADWTWGQLPSSEPCSLYLWALIPLTPTPAWTQAAHSCEPHLLWQLCFPGPSSSRGKPSTPPVMKQTHAGARPWAVRLSLSSGRLREGLNQALLGSLGVPSTTERAARPSDKGLVFSEPYFLPMKCPMPLLPPRLAA